MSGWEAVQTWAPFAGAVGVALLGAGATYQELATKPSMEQVRHEVQAPVRQLESEAAKLERRVFAVERGADRASAVLELLLLQSDWQEAVLQHVGEKRKGKPPPPPPEIQEKRRELMR
jgi:hypothetical protein